MLYRARIGLLLLSALSAHMVPACGRSFGRDRDVARAASQPEPASFSLAAAHHAPLVAASRLALDDSSAIRELGDAGDQFGRRFITADREGIAPYATSSAAERASLEGARAPYADVDAILITHWHEDHFSPNAVAAHLSSNPRAILVSSTEVVGRVRAVAPGLAASRLRAVLRRPATASAWTSAARQCTCCASDTTRRDALPSSTSASSSANRRRCCTSATPIPPPTTSRCCARFPRRLAFLPFWYATDATNQPWWPSDPAAAHRRDARPAGQRREG